MLVALCFNLLLLLSPPLLLLSASAADVFDPLVADLRGFSDDAVVAKLLSSMVGLSRSDMRIHAASGTDCRL